MKKIFFHTFVMALCLVANPSQAKSYGQGLGRLLTTESERARLDEFRFNPFSASGNADTLPPQMHIEGMTVRAEQPIGSRITIWIDGRPYLERDLPQGLKLRKSKNGEVLGVESRVKADEIEFARIGDKITRPQTAQEAKALAEKDGKPKPKP
jgi:hypothetical protein